MRFYRQHILYIPYNLHFLVSYTLSFPTWFLSFSKQKSNERQNLKARPSLGLCLAVLLYNFSSGWQFSLIEQKPTDIEYLKSFHIMQIKQ